MSGQAIPTKSLLQYGFIAVPIAFAGFPLYIIAPDFYATHFGVSLTLLGSLLLALRLFDAVLDPVIGWLADRQQGRFLSALVVSSILLCLSIFGLFNFVAFTPAVWFAICTFLAVASYSVLTIVLGAQATLWTTDKNEQTRIAATRESFGLIGLITAVSLPTTLLSAVKQEHVYIWYCSILTLLSMIGVLAWRQLFQNLKPTNNHLNNTEISFLSGLRALPRETRKLYAVYSMSMLASSVPAVLVLFYVRDLLGAEHLTGAFLLLYFLSGAAGMPLWKRLSHGVGKYKTWAYASMLAIAGFLGAFFLKTGDIWPYGFVCVTSGLALGADLTLPPSILADHIHARDKAAYSGTYYALLAFVAKASLAFASAMALPALDAAGFKPRAVNSGDALLVLSATYALIPCVLKLVSMGLLYVFFIRTCSGGKNEIIKNLNDCRSDIHA